MVRRVTGSIYDIFIDADNGPSTGYSINDIGADYLLRHIAGYPPALYKYTGSDTDWSFPWLKNEDYLYNPGDLSEAVYVVPKSDFTAVSLSSKIAIVGETENKLRAV